MKGHQASATLLVYIYIIYIDRCIGDRRVVSWYINLLYRRYLKKKKKRTTDHAPLERVPFDAIKYCDAIQEKAKTTRRPFGQCTCVCVYVCSMSTIHDLSFDTEHDLTTNPRSVRWRLYRQKQVRLTTKRSMQNPVFLKTLTHDYDRETATFEQND
jgi:hypothetical protein